MPAERRFSEEETDAILERAAAEDASGKHATSPGAGLQNGDYHVLVEPGERGFRL